MALKRTPALIALRAATLLLAGAPALLVAALGLRQRVAHTPLYTDPAHLPALDLLLLLRALPPALPLALAFGVAFAALLQPLLSAAAARLYRRHAPPASAIQALRSVADDLLAPLLRLAALTTLPALLLALLAAALLPRLARYGEPAGWTGLTLEALLPAAAALLPLLAAHLAGAFALAARTHLAATSPTPTARAALRHAAALLLRRPFTRLAPTLLLPLAAHLASGALLVAWRLQDPRGASLVLLITGFVALILLQSAAWTWLHRHLQPEAP